MANRHQARESTLETLYAWSTAKQDPEMLPGLLESRLQHEEREDQDENYFRESVYAITDHVEALDEVIKTAVRGRSLRSVAQIEINVLRLAVWEMQSRLEIPYRVIINEALELTRDYAGEPPRSFINGVLDNLAKQIRPAEMKEKK
ncbi:MAG: transcription antitermination factor NusB [Mariprofundus sp.]|nr:transcription antitermination factor NusB [Mariprofundus sp.]